MLIGVCSSDFKRSNAADLFEKVRNHGFEILQFGFASITETDFVPDRKIELPPEIPAKALAAVEINSAKTNIPVQVINGTFNMAHPDGEIRTEGIRRMEILCKAAKELGCPFISLCSGTRNAADLWRYSPENHTVEARNDMLDTVLRCTEIAEKHGITLAVETERGNIIDTPEAARKLLDTVNSERLKMILDCANLFHNGRAKKEFVREEIAKAFDFFGKDIVVAHGKDVSDDDEIRFVPTGEGIVDFGFFIEKLNEYGYKGDMFLHSIFDETKMQTGINVIKKGTVN